MRNDNFNIYSWRKDFLREKLLTEAKKDEKDPKDEEVVDDVELEDTETPSEEELSMDTEDMGDEFSDANLSDEEIKIQNSLKTLFDKSKEVNDPKFTTLISNAITYFTKNHITKTDNI